MKLPKLKLLSRRANNIEASPFDALVQEAVEVTQRLRALDSDPAASKVTSQAFLAECMALDDSITESSIRKLRKSLEKNSPQLNHSNASLRRMVSALRGPHLSSPPPAKHLDRAVRWLDTEPSRVALAKIGSSTLELLCCAVIEAGEKHPEVFGRRNSSAEIIKERSDLTAKRDELFRRIASEATMADLQIDDAGTKPVTFACAPTVGLAPKGSAGERLVSHLISQGALVAFLEKQRAEAA